MILGKKEVRRYGVYVFYDKNGIADEYNDVFLKGLKEEVSHLLLIDQFQSTAELLLFISVYPCHGSLPGCILPVVHCHQERSTLLRNGIPHNPSCLLHLCSHDSYSLKDRALQKALQLLTTFYFL